MSEPTDRPPAMGRDGEAPVDVPKSEVIEFDGGWDLYMWREIEAAEWVERRKHPRFSTPATENEYKIGRRLLAEMARADALERLLTTLTAAADALIAEYNAYKAAKEGSRE